MNNESLFDKAVRLATKWHEGQKRWGGEPYIIHPLAVAELVDTYMYGETARIVAVLHDTIEDTDATVSDIKREFSDKIGNAVWAMSHQQGEDYGAYYARVAGNPIAIDVKLADIKHNMSTLNYDGKQDKKLTRVRRERYQLARHYLTQMQAMHRVLGVV